MVTLHMKWFKMVTLHMTPCRGEVHRMQQNLEAAHAAQMDYDYLHLQLQDQEATTKQMQQQVILSVQGSTSNWAFAACCKSPSLLQTRSLWLRCTSESNGDACMAALWTER